VFGVVVPADDDPGKDDYISVHPALLAALARKLGLRGGKSLPAGASPPSDAAACLHLL
jgi:hypothetical protein